MDLIDFKLLMIDGGFLVLFFILLLISKLINDFLTPYSIDSELTQKDNPALAVSLCGYLLATAIIFVGALLGPEIEVLDMKNIQKDMLITAYYVGIGIVLLNIARLINDKILLYTFSNVKEIVEDRNVGTGAVQFGSYLASGMIIAGSIHGEGGGIYTVLVFFILGQLALIVFTMMYNMITPFNIHEEIEKDNVAAGIAFGGTLIALGIILMKATSGDFISWEVNLMSFAINAAMAIILLPVIRYVLDRVMIPKSSLNEEIEKDKNIGAAFLEVTLSISVATVLFFIMI